MLNNTQQLLDIMARLRRPEDGCAWDLKQDFTSLIPYVIEEAYEVVDAIERNDLDDLRSELGDLLLQVVFHSQIAQERGLFDFEEVSAGICESLFVGIPMFFPMQFLTPTPNAIRLGNKPKLKSGRKKTNCCTR